MKSLKAILLDFARDESGNSVAEYAMILAVTVVAVAFGLNTIEHPITDFFDSAGGLFQGLINEGGE
jgi:Flp pilus assembly pilin Flp